MLQDLDSLAARIGQMVQFTRELQAQRADLLARLKTLEHERNALREQLGLREAESHAAHALSEQHASEIQALRDQAEASQAELQSQLARYQAECEAARQNLEQSKADSGNLRAVAAAARERIDMILMRLPGATGE